jgi:Fur family ferric uptake transcriptional regulator
MKRILGAGLIRSNQERVLTSPTDLKTIGLKTTVPRTRILEFFEKNEVRHASAEDVYKALNAEGTPLPLATIYRVLMDFERAGLLLRQPLNGRTVFERNDGRHHDHLVCMQCGRFEEFYDSGIENHQETIAAARGFKIQSHSLRIFVECTKPDCPRRPKE